MRILACDSEMKDDIFETDLKSKAQQIETQKQAQRKAANDKEEQYHEKARGLFSDEMNLRPRP